MLLTMTEAKALNTNTRNALRAQVDTLTDMLAGAKRRAANEPGNAELAAEIRYLDGQLDTAVDELRETTRAARRGLKVRYEWMPTGRAGGPALELRAIAVE